MKREFEITFGFWFTHTLGYFEIEDLDDSVTYITRKKVITAENKENAETKLKHKWATKIDIKSIKEIEKEKTL